MSPSDQEAFVPSPLHRAVDRISAVTVRTQLLERQISIQTIQTLDGVADQLREIVQDLKDLSEIIHQIPIEP